MSTMGGKGAKGKGVPRPRQPMLGDWMNWYPGPSEDQWRRWMPVKGGKAKGGPKAGKGVFPMMGQDETPCEPDAFIGDEDWKTLFPALPSSWGF